MLRRYSFLILFLGLLSGLAWWSDQIDATSQWKQSPGGKVASSASSVAEAESARRRELIEVLDRLVAYEHYYRSVYGHFTKLVTRLGFQMPTELLDLCDVRVIEASRDQLLVTAFSEVEGRTRDVVSIDQDFLVRASFDLPAPRPEYLRALASKQLRSLRDAPQGQVVMEQGVFRGYFRYETRRDSLDRKVAIATGIQPPVLGLQLELGAVAPDGVEPEVVATYPQGSPAAEEEVGLWIPAPGQKPMVHVMSTMEEAYLAQRIFRGEVGRYARNWAELSRIARFRFEDREKYGNSGKVPFGDTVEEIEVEAERGDRDSVRAPASDFEPLEIEEILPSVKKD